MSDDNGDLDFALQPKQGLEMIWKISWVYIKVKYLFSEKDHVSVCLSRFGMRKHCKGASTQHFQMGAFVSQRKKFIIPRGTKFRAGLLNSLTMVLTC